MGEARRWATRTVAMGLLLAAFLPVLALAQTDPADGEGPSVGVPSEPAPVPGPPGWTLEVDAAFGTYLVTPIARVLLFDLWFWDDPDVGVKLPLIVAWLVLGATFFTLRMRFVNLWGLPHAARVTLGHYDDEEEEGEVSHFQALSSALSATVGLGNIGGVAGAVSIGGPGAVFWMVVAGFLGMSSKFTECTLGQMYRKVDDGVVLGGPMRYLKHGLEDLEVPESLRAARSGLGTFLSVAFAFLCIGGSFGGGNMFQANQAFSQAVQVFSPLRDYPVTFGVALAVLVGIVIVGGIKRIGSVAERIVPFMCGLYVLAGLVILGAYWSDVPSAFALIVSDAFNPRAVAGGVIGVLVVGFQRAAFSNEAGVGSAAIAHSAASTAYPIREGLVALLEPLIDTIIVCTMTGLVIVVSGQYQTTEEGIQGVELTSRAFASVLPWFPYLLAVAVLLFAFSTMISWSYYGERSATYLFGPRASFPYRILFLFVVVLGPVLTLENIFGFSDLMILGMALPNILGLFLLSGKVKDALDRYVEQFMSPAPAAEE
jgi:AGCS family alanine or glycine:cation symporter